MTYNIHNPICEDCDGVVLTNGHKFNCPQMEERNVPTISAVHFSNGPVRYAYDKITRNGTNRNRRAQVRVNRITTKGEVDRRRNWRTI